MIPLLASLPCAVVFLALTLLSGDSLEEALAQARKLRRAGSTSAAITLLDNARTTLGAQPGLDGLLGTLLLDAGQIGPARKLAAALADHDGTNYRALIFLGRFAAEEDGDEERALKAYREAAKLKPQPLEALQGLVSLFLRQERFGKAAKRAEAIAEFDPVLGRQLLGDSYLAQAEQLRQGGAEMLPLAINRYKLALQQRPDDLGIVRKLLEVLLLTIHLDEARELNAAAFGEATQRGERLFWSGRIHESARDLAAARSDFRESYALQPQQGTVCLHLARLALSEGRSDSARDWLALGIEAMGESPRSLVLMAQVHNGLGDTEDALRCLSRAVAIDRRNAGARYQLARTLLRLGRRQEGAAAMEAFKAIQQAARPPIDDD